MPITRAASIHRERFRADAHLQNAHDLAAAERRRGGGGWRTGAISAVIGLPRLLRCALHENALVARAFACSQQDAGSFLEHVLDDGHRLASIWMVKQLGSCDQELCPALHCCPNCARCYSALELECSLKDWAQ